MNLRDFVQTSISQIVDGINGDAADGTNPKASQLLTANHYDKCLIQFDVMVYANRNEPDTFHVHFGASESQPLTKVSFSVPIYISSHSDE